MALALDVRTDRRITLEDLVVRLERELDPRDDETLIGLAPDLAALANDTTFLGDFIAAELADPGNFQRGFAYYGRSFVLARSKTFVVRANLWDPLAPNSGDYEPPEVRRQIGMYDLLHDHDFSFITVGYFGPGYATDLYECEPERVAGHLGEYIELRSLGTHVLSPGSLLYFERRRHVHLQGTPPSPTISINVIALDPTTPFKSQYYLDPVTSRIVALTSDPYNGRRLLCDLAAVMGLDDAAASLSSLAATHPSAGLRLHAYEALATLTGDDARAVWLRAAHDPDRHVRQRALAAFDGQPPPHPAGEPSATATRGNDTRLHIPAGGPS